MTDLYLRDLVQRERVMREAIDTLDGPAPSVQVQESYAKQHPPPKTRGGVAVMIEVNGVSMNACAWARSRGFPLTKVHERLNSGWHPHAAVLGNLGETKQAAHARLKLAPITGPGADTGRRHPKVTKEPPAVVFRAPAIYLDGHTIRIDAGEFRMKPAQADELALNLIRMAEDIRRRFAR